MPPKIYTKTGDHGTSALYDGQRRPKHDGVFAATGALDELSAQLGVAKAALCAQIGAYNTRAKDAANQGGEPPAFAQTASSFCTIEVEGVRRAWTAVRVDDETAWIDELQRDLLDAGSAVATPLTGKKGASSSKAAQRVRFHGDYVKRLEERIDDWDAQLPQLKNFILPQGGAAASALHVARTVCRRAERKISVLVESGENEVELLQFINRLSDLLFVAARRYAQSEAIYKK